MVTFVKGNIFDSPAQVLTNPINCVGKMGKGLAKVFADKFPAMEKNYIKRCSENKVKIGAPYLWEDDKTQILNFPTKKHWKNLSNIQDIEEGLNFIAQNYIDMGIGTLALPALGAGLGGLDWNEVKEVIFRVLNPISDLHVFVYEPVSKGSKLESNTEESDLFTYSDSVVAASSL